MAEKILDDSKTRDKRTRGWLEWIEIMKRMEIIKLVDDICIIRGLEMWFWGQCYVPFLNEEINVELNFPRLSFCFPQGSLIASSSPNTSMNLSGFPLLCRETFCAGCRWSGKTSCLDGGCSCGGGTCNRLPRPPPPVTNASKNDVSWWAVGGGGGGDKKSAPGRNGGLWPPPPTGDWLEKKSPLLGTLDRGRTCCCGGGSTCCGCRCCTVGCCLCCCCGGACCGRCCGSRCWSFCCCWRLAVPWTVLGPLVVDSIP